MTKRFPLVFLTAVLTVGLSIAPALAYGEETKLVADDGAAWDNFGQCLAISKNTIVIGSHNDDDNGYSSGSAYVFERGGSSWVQSEKLNASDTAAGDYFGISGAISGTTIVVGSYGDDDTGSASGSAYVFELSGGSWVQSEKIIASDAAAGDWFGRTVAISKNTIVVGSYGDDDNGFDSGSAYVFERSGDSWVQSEKLIASDAAAEDWFGRTIAISENTIVIGAPCQGDTGSAYVFERSGGSWVQSEKLTASDAAVWDYFGISVAIDGNTIVVGSYGDDDNGFDSGSAYVFERSGDSWVQSEKLIGSNTATGDLFGYSLAISKKTIVVGAIRNDDAGYQSGSAYVFKFQARSRKWVESDKLTASDGEAEDHFGGSVAISGKTIVVGADGDDDSGLSAGSAYVYKVGSGGKK
jgi:hypothetical protein